MTGIRYLNFKVKSLLGDLNFIFNGYNNNFYLLGNDYLSLEHPTCTPETNILIVHGEGAGDDNQDYYPSDFEAVREL